MSGRDFRAIAPAVARLEGATLPGVERFTLSNGVRVVAFDGGTQPVNMVSLVREGGTADVDSSAAMQLLLSTMGEGTVSRSGSEVANIIDGNGSWIKSAAYGHHTVVSMFSLNSRMVNVVPVFGDMVENAVFPERELDMKKCQMAQQLEVQMQKVGYMAEARLRKLVCGVGHPLAQEMTPQDVLDTSRDFVGETFNRMRQPWGAHLYIGGMLGSEVMDAVCGAMESLGSSGLPAIGRRVVPLCSEAPVLEKIEVPDALQSKVCMGIPVVGRHHPDYPMLHVVTMALGGFFGSRLMMNLREERGLTYGVNASLLGVHEGAWVKIGFECSHEHVAEAIEQVRHELAMLASNPPKGEELERLRRFALVSHLETLDSPMEIISFYRTMEVSDVPADYFEAKQRAILGVTSEDVARIASTYLVPDRLRIVVAGR